MDLHFTKLVLQEAILNCQTLGGTIPLPNNRHDAKLQIEIIKKSMRNPAESTMMLLPLKKDLTNLSSVYQYTGVWQHHLDKIEPVWLEWAPGQPNGDTFESCVGVGVGAGDDTPAVYDVECSQPWDSLCRVSKVTLFRVRGLCEALEDIVDHKYFVNFEKNKDGNEEEIVWEGYTQSRIEYDQRIKRWRIISDKNFSTVLTAVNKVIL